MATIKVTGSAECALPVDTATVHLTVKRVKKTADEASKAVNEGIAALERRLAANWFAQSSLKTVSFSVAPEYEYENGVRKAVGYACRCRMKCEFAYTQKAVVNAVAAMTEGGAEEEFSLSFGVQDETETKRGLLASACKEAKSKAEAIAAAIGKKLGGCVGVEECGVQEGGAVRCMSAHAGAPEDAAVSVSVVTEWEIL